jgi:hypothetical protein
MAQSLAALLERPPIEHHEKKIRSALQVQIPESEWLRECRRDTETALTLIEKNQLSRRRPEQNKGAIARLLAALKPLRQNCHGSKSGSLEPSAICARASRSVSMRRTSRTRQLRKSLARQVIGSSMPCKQPIIWCSCGWPSAIAFTKPTNSAIKVSGTNCAPSRSKDVNMLPQLRRYRNAMDRAHAAVGHGDDRKLVPRKPSQIVPVSDAGGALMRRSPRDRPTRSTARLTSPVRGRTGFRKCA